MIRLEVGEKSVLENFPKETALISKMEKPEFEKHQPDLKGIKKTAAKFKRFKNVVLIGNGGSRTSAWAFYHSLFQFRNKVNFEFVSSAEPELIGGVRKKYSPKDTLVLAVSKSGTNVNSLEPLLLLSDYPVLALTGEKESKLREMASALGWETAVHPEVGGRFSGLTASGLIPAALMGLSVEKIYAGGKKGYLRYGSKNISEKNPALVSAAYFWSLEKKGYDQIFSSVYSSSLFAFLPLIVQLVHESSGKDGLGQTIFGDYAPESQHHTNQRFFGGRKNVAGLFMGVEKSRKDLRIKVPKKLSSMKFGDSDFSVFSGISALETMHFDLRGVRENARKKGIPEITLWLDEFSPEGAGEFMVFWQYFAVYSAMLRSQNPFDQPEVEDSKRISWELRKMSGKK